MQTLLRSLLRVKWCGSEEKGDGGLTDNQHVPKRGALREELMLPGSSGELVDSFISRALL